MSDEAHGTPDDPTDSPPPKPPRKPRSRKNPPRERKPKAIPPGTKECPRCHQPKVSVRKTAGDKAEKCDECWAKERPEGGTR